MFVDEAVITVRSGRGGDGFMHFHREKYVSRGGPDGGDGGRGGSLILKVNRKLNTLATFRNTTRYVAEDGKKGGVNNMTGRSAPDLVLQVPPGTIVRDANTDELIGDLVTDGQELIVATAGAVEEGTPTSSAPPIRRRKLQKKAHRPKKENSSWS